MSTSEIQIVVPGRMHPHAVERISGTFRIVEIEKSDPALLSPEVASAIRGIAVVGTSMGIGPSFVDALPNLEIVANFGVGYDSVDARYCATKGICVTNTPDVLSEEVADTAMGLLLMAARELPAAERYLRAGQWVAKGPFPLTRATLRGRKLGILGLGRIGKAIARRAEAFGLEIHYHGRSRQPDVAYRYHETLLGMAEACDTLMVVAPGGASTKGIVNAEVLQALGPEGIVVNVGRGTVIDEPALVKALQDGTILSAGLDVFEDEPRVPQALIDLEHVVLLPHVGSASQHTRNAMGQLVVDNLLSWFQNGKPVTPVAETPFVRKV